MNIARYFKTDLKIVWKEIKKQNVQFQNNKSKIFTIY